MQRVSTGIEGLDTMLHGGLVPGRSYVLTGPPGSGKSILGMHFLLEGIRNGESVILVSIDEPPNEI
ncbi:MAG: RAD55 family ATPase, partial [Thermoplasmata archaeon]